jgi:hypothetical protein
VGINSNDEKSSKYLHEEKLNYSYNIPTSEIGSVQKHTTHGVFLMGKNGVPMFQPEN